MEHAEIVVKSDDLEVRDHWLDSLRQHEVKTYGYYVDSETFKQLLKEGVVNQKQADLTPEEFVQLDEAMRGFSFDGSSPAEPASSRGAASSRQRQCQRTPRAIPEETPEAAALKAEKNPGWCFDQDEVSCAHLDNDDAQGSQERRVQLRSFGIKWGTT